MIALHRGICPKNGTGKVFKGKGGYPADVRPVTHFTLYSKMVYSASLRLAVSQGNPPGKASYEFQSVADADCDTGVENSERASA